MSAHQHAQRITAKIREAWGDPRPSRPIDEIFERLEALHTQTIDTQHYDQP